MRFILRDAHRVLELSGCLGVFAAILLSGPLAGATARISLQSADIDALAQRSGGRLTESALSRAFADMDPGALALARRFAPPASTAHLASASLPTALTPPPVQPAAPDPADAAAVNDATPFSTAPNPAAAPFVLRADLEDRARAVDCLTQAIYYEAGFEPVEGERAVAQVVLNRLRHPIFPKTVCGVVYQGAQLTTGCQFSFTCDGSLGRPPVAWAWRQARDIAEQALNGSVEAKVGGATHYHTRAVVPWWAPTVTKVAQIGAHIFYRWPGGLGLPGAFNGHYAGGERLMQVAASRSDAIVIQRGPDGRVHGVFAGPSAPGLNTDLATNRLPNAIGGSATVAALAANTLSGEPPTAPATPSERIAARAYLQKALKACDSAEAEAGAVCRKW